MHLVDNAHSKYNDNQYSPLKGRPTTQIRGKVNKKNQQDEKETEKKSNLHLYGGHDI